MVININVKVKGGARTKVEVGACLTSVNPKIMKFKNGRTVSEEMMAQLIESYLCKKLNEIQNGDSL